MDKAEVFKLIETHLLNSGIEVDLASEIADSLTEIMDEEGVFDSSDDEDFDF